MVRKNQYVSITKDVYEPHSTSTHTTHHNGSNNSNSNTNNNANVNNSNNINNNNTVDKKKKKDFDNIPPYSRLFIVCDRDATEEEIENVFKSYGNIEYCRMLKEKKTSDSKGICYIKFDKTSSAAKALEELNGIVITANGTPIKIQIAEPKNAKKKIYSKDPEDTPPRSRLFVVCPKEMSEETLNERFKDFEDLEYCKVITDKTNGDSKGFAYVKFSKASSAAKAMEEILKTGLIAGMKIKILISDPKEKRFEHNETYPQALYMLPYHPEIPYVPPYPISNRIEIISGRYIAENDLNELLQRYPGFEYNHFLSTNDDPHVAVKLQSEFASIEAASFAQYHLHGLEFPPGNYLHCAFVYPEYPSPMYQNLYYPPHPVYPPHYSDLAFHTSYFPQQETNDHSAAHGHGQFRGNKRAEPMMIPNYAWPTWGYSTSPPSDYRF